MICKTCHRHIHTINQLANCPMVTCPIRQKASSPDYIRQREDDSDVAGFLIAASLFSHFDATPTQKDDSFTGGAGTSAGKQTQS